MDTTGEDKMLLSGQWKFNTLQGDGSNYLNVHPEKDDIIIDNSDTAQVEIKGTWSTSTNTRGGINFWSDDYLISSDGSDSSSYVRFKPEIQASEYHEVFVYYPFGIEPQVKINVKHTNGVSTRYFNQRVKSGNWLSLGVFKFDEASESYIEIKSNIGVVADAIMLRPVASSIIDKVKKEKEQVYLPTYDDSDWKALRVPGHWGMLNEYSNYTGKGWYRNTFHLPKDWKQNGNERLTLKFDAVYHVARVFLNGEYIGMNRGGFTPFDFDVTDNVNFEGENVLAVEADNNYQVGATWNWGGIIRDVHLIRNNDVLIQHQYIHAEPDLLSGKAEVNLKIRLENKSANKREVTINSEVIDSKSLLTLTQLVSLEPHSSKEVRLEGTLAAKDVKLWHFDAPQLYQLETRIHEGGKLLHRKDERFGIRKVEATASQLLLNGEPVRLAGLNRVSDHRYWGSSEPLELIIQDVDLMKNAGANFMRIMHGTQNEKLIEQCDEKGIMIFEEVNVRNLNNPEFTAPDYPLVKRWLREMIERDSNHPSIIGWSVGNELRNHFEYIEDMISYVKNDLDSNRLVTYVSNSGHSKNDPIIFGDIIMHNCYNKTPESQINTLHKHWPDKPIFFSEFSPRRFKTTSLDEDLPELSDWYNVIRGKYPFVIGGSLWTYNDYRSAYIETTAEENRTWGLVNSWRQKRRLYSRMQQENSPVKGLIVDNIDLSSSSAKIEIITKQLSDYPSYTLNSHTLHWSFFDKSGAELKRGHLLLPTLKPGDKWNGSIVGKKNQLNASCLKIEILSPGGFVRSSKTIYFKVPNPPIINHVIEGDSTVRILFDKVFGAEEYFVSCFEGGAKLLDSKKTIMNYVDLEGLENGKEYQFQVVACNSKGESISLKSLSATPDGRPLPPVIWDAFMDRGKLVIGYSSEKEDELYSVRYGGSEENMNKTFTSNVKGMMTIDLGQVESCAFKIKRIQGEVESHWSTTKIIK
jgi:beta-galactosidase